jgi:PAS domain S-box-containing protein
MSTTQNSLRELLRGVGTLNAGVQVDKPLSRKGSAAGKRKGRAALKQKSGHKDLLDAFFDRAAPFYLADTSGDLVITSAAFRNIAPHLFGTDDVPASLDETPDPILALMEQLDAHHEDIKQTDTVSIVGKKRHFISEHFCVLDDKDNIVGFGGIYEDVTPVARANGKAGDMERWLCDVIRSSSDWVWSVDHNFNLTFASPRITEAIGIPSQTLTGRHFFTLGEFEDRDGGQQTREDMEAHRPFRDRAMLMEGTEGDTRHIIVSGVPVFNEASGRFVGYRGTGTDVTRQFNAEQSATRANADLEQTLGELRQRNNDLAFALEQSQVADKAKIDFLAMMSHELRTPLNCIIGFSDAATQKIHGPLKESYVEYFSNIHKAGTHLLDIINDILDTANIEAGNLTIEPLPTRVADLVDEAANMVEPKIGDKRKIVTKKGKVVDTDLLVVADRLRAKQILVNLLGNALKFTPEGGQIGVDVALVPKELVDITVWDTGIGIPEDELEQVFNPFYQVEKNILVREVEGAGLGLAISKQLAQLMKGDLSVESTVGKGTRFTLSLPQAKPK